MQIATKNIIILFFLFFCLLTTISSAQKIDTATQHKRIINRDFNDIYTQNLKLSTFGNDYGGPNKTMLISDLVGNFVLVNTPKLPFFVVATPEISIRLFSAFGSPVKSPSYMPGFAIYFRANSDQYHPKFFSVGYNHHSNGIEGPTANANGTINVDSGKFTTNFYTFIYHTGTRTDKENLIINNYQSAGLELHAGLIGLGYAHALAGRYGWVRAKGNWTYSLAKKYDDPIDPNKKEFHDWMRVQLDLQYIMDKYNGYSLGEVKKRMNVSLKYYYQLPFMQNVAFMAGGGYRGQDEYNIYFQDSYAYFIFGLSAGLSFGTRR
jgi:hypothetical protein